MDKSLSWTGEKLERTSRIRLRRERERDDCPLLTGCDALTGIAEALDFWVGSIDATSWEEEEAFDGNTPCEGYREKRREEKRREEVN